MATETSGYCRLKSAKTSGRMWRQVPSLALTVSSPRGTRSVSRTAVSKARRVAIVSSQNFWKTLPDAVRETLPPERSNSLAPTSSSRERICEEIAGCVRKRLSAAREKLAWRATSRKVSSWSKSIRPCSSTGCHYKYSTTRREGDNFRGIDAGESASVARAPSPQKLIHPRRYLEN